MTVGHVHQAAAAPRLLETLTVPGFTANPVTTKTTLKQGSSYRLEVSGTITSAFTPPGGPTIGEREDAFYCFEELNEAAVSPTSSCTKNIRYLGALRARIGGFNDFVENALGIQGRICQVRRRLRLSRSPRRLPAATVRLLDVREELRRPGRNAQSRLFGRAER